VGSDLGSVGSDLGSVGSDLGSVGSDLGSVGSDLGSVGSGIDPQALRNLWLKWCKTAPSVGCLSRLTLACH
jgi:hypothetical protein